VPGSELDAQGALTLGGQTTVPATAAYTEGVHYWETTAAAFRGYSYYGVVGSDAAAPPPAGVLGEVLGDLDAGGWGGWAVRGDADGGTGPAYSKGEPHGSAAEPPPRFRPGQRLGLKLDMGARTVAYYLDGEAQGVVFTGLPSHVWPAASNHSGSAVYSDTAFGLPPPA
jgi:hypothetical protein